MTKHDIATVLTLSAALFFFSKSAGNAGGFNGRCQLEVDKVTYINGPCEIGVFEHGSFSVGGGGMVGSGTERRAKYLAMITIDPAAGTVTGVWNDPDGESHLHDDLGSLVRQGACWVNNRVKVCARR